MIPSRQLVLLLLGPLGLALVSLLDTSLRSVMLATDAALVLVAAIDALLGASRSIRVERDVRSILSVGRNNLVTLHLRSTARRRLVVEITDDVPDSAETSGLPARVTLPPFGTASIRYQLRPTRRGAYELGAHTVRYSTPLGLWHRQLRLPASSKVDVYPDVGALRAHELLARQDRAQVRATRRVGGESEFERLREYARDDEYRAIDWKATARRGKLIARQYQLERNQTIYVMLDAGRLMTAESQGLPLFDHGLNAALMLSHIATRGGDRAGLTAFGDRVLVALAPVAGRSAIVRLVRATYDIQPELVDPDYAGAFGKIGHQLRQRTLVVVITRVTDDVSVAALARCTAGLLPRHLPLVILLRDPEIEAMATVRSDDDEAMLHRRAAAAELLDWHDRAARQLRGLGAHVLDVEPRQVTTALVNRYLEIKVRQWL